MIKCLCDEIKWGEWLRHGDLGLANWSFGNKSEEGSSALDNPGSLPYDNVRGWISGADSVNSCGSR